jgi:hypothetical protein
MPVEALLKAGQDYAHHRNAFGASWASCWAGAAIATGLSALDRGIRSNKHPAKAWPDDRDVALVLRGIVEPITRDDAQALQAISTAFLAALVPMSAAADLFERALALKFGAEFGARAAGFSVPSR